MDITNVTEFRNFVKNNNLTHLDRELEAVVICVQDYERGCACWKAADLQKVYDNCRCLYVKAVGLVIRQYAAQFRAYTLDGIRFSTDGRAIGAI